MLVDVHVIQSGREPTGWARECLSSLIGHPIKIHVVPFVPGSIWNARQYGFSQGQSPYVSFVDLDDIVMPGAFASCIESLQDNPMCVGAYTTSHIITGDGVDKGAMHPYRPWSSKRMMSNRTEIHQLVVIRREVLNNAVQLLHGYCPPFLNEQFLYMVLAILGPWVAVDHDGYRWRKHAGGHHHRYYDAENSTTVRQLLIYLRKLNKLVQQQERIKWSGNMNTLMQATYSIIAQNK